MASLSAPAPVDAPGAHLVLYDGACGLCSGVVEFLLEHDRRAVFAFASLQSATGRAIVERFGGNPDELTSFYIVTNYRATTARMFNRGAAAMFVAGTLGWPWKAAGILRLLPASILDRAYDIVAANRYRMFGRAEQCLLPRRDLRSRFVD